MNLADLIAATLTGPATLTDSSGNTSQLTTSAVARLWTAVSDDRTKMSLYGLPEAAKQSVTLEQADDEGPVVKVGDTLRYMINLVEDSLERLCTAPGCLNESAGSTVLTRVCYEHLNVIIPGMLPNAGDDILPGDRESAAQESRKKRLDAWQEEVEASERDNAGSLRVIAKLRTGDL